MTSTHVHVPARPRAAAAPATSADRPDASPRGGPEPSGLTPGEIRRIVLDLLG